MKNQNSYLFHLTHDFLEFRLPELEMICQNISKPNCITNHNYSNDSPIFTCNLPDEQTALEIGNRSFLLKSISKLICEGESLDDMLKNFQNDHIDLEIEKGDTFKIEVYSYAKIYSQEEKLQKIEKIVEGLKFDEKELKVCLNDKLVKHKFFYAEEWIQAESTLEENDSGKNRDKFLRRCFLAKFICYGQSSVAHKYNLKDRSFIGNTSMDPLLSLIMANMANVNQTSFIFDPFVGTGSLLVGAAHCGAHVLGAELDYNLVHSRGLSSRMGQKYRKKDENIRNNLKQYGLESKYVDILAADFSTEYIKKSFLFDAIITDPPYGIREKAKKIGSKNSKINQNKSPEVDNNKTLHFVQHIKYNLGDIYLDLLDFASNHLTSEGRLVYWLPIYLNIDRNGKSNDELRKILIEFIPCHQDLYLKYFSEQRLTQFTSRLLVTMIKKPQVDVLGSNFDELNTNHENNKTNRSENKNSEILNQFRDKYFSSKNK